MPNSLAERIAGLDWNSLQQMLDEQGFAAIPALLDKDQCNEIVSKYEGLDYKGGEFMLMEQRPRAQSRGHVITLGTRYSLGIIFHDAK